ncbi:vinorine synthase-like [Silene latifolia]|uniref:vinorine synthase-like n=1 Tax=Silene latifolia TaxID=37657 RepID=UPI003D77B9C7
MNDPQVKQKSCEFIKPLNPTSPKHKHFVLSFIDQNFPPVHLPLLLIYPSWDSPIRSSDDIISTLKTSLSETLTIFYPLAGRCIGQTTVSCNDQGVPFIETVVNCRLDDVLNSPTKIDVLSKLLPPMDLFSFGQLPISEVLPLAFQINIFACGGVVIGCYMLHKLLDAASISTFLNYWAGHAKNRDLDLLRPNFDAAVTAFPPPSSNVDDTTIENSGGGNPGIAMLWNRLGSIKVVVKSFIFNNATIKKLKVDGSSKVVPTPTSFEAVVGFVWQHVMPAGPSVVSFSANIRNRTIPPLPRESMGNLLIGLHPRVDKRGELTDLVKEIHNEVLKLEQKVESLKGENGVDAFLACRDSGCPAGTTLYNLSSWCNLGMDRVDFGFGKPSKIIPYGMVNPLLRNSIMLVDYTDCNGDGIEVWLFLEEKEMEILESNPQFLAFASPT